MPAADRSSILIAAAFSFHFSSAANYRNGNEQDRLAKSWKLAYDVRNEESEATTIYSVVDHGNITGLSDEKKGNAK